MVFSAQVPNSPDDASDEGIVQLQRGSPLRRAALSQSTRRSSCRTPTIQAGSGCPARRSGKPVLVQGFARNVALLVEAQYLTTSRGSESAKHASRLLRLRQGPSRLSIHGGMCEMVDQEVLEREGLPRSHRPGTETETQQLTLAPTEVTDGPFDRAVISRLRLACRRPWRHLCPRCLMGLVDIAAG
jgi:hypothetical protein